MGRAGGNLEQQALLPLFSAQEMANTPAGVEAALRGNETYVALFRDAFGDAPTVGRTAAVGQVKCAPIIYWDAQSAAFDAAASHKWDRQAMGCAVGYGAQSLEDLSFPTNLIWAFVTMRADNIERHLEVLGANIE